MKKTCYAYIVAFFFLCFAPLLARFFGIGQSSSSEFEKRELSEKPALSIENYSDYPTQFEAFFNDTIPFRKTWITWNNRINYALSSGSSSGSIIQGREGWLFYNPAGTDGDPIGDYYGTISRYSMSYFSNLSDLLMDNQKRLEERGCNFILMVIPNKECMYGPDYFPFYYPRSKGPTSADSFCSYVKENSDVNLIYTKQVLQAAMAEHPEYLYYYKQDSHWNTLGAYLGARQLLTQLSVRVPEMDTLSIQEETKDIEGDIASMMGLCKSQPNEIIYKIDYDGKQSFSKEIIAGIEPDGFIRTHCPGADQRKLMVVRDSYCIAMIDFLSSQFENCFYVHRQDYSPALIDAEKPDILVYETVERYMGFLPYFHVE